MKIGPALTSYILAEELEAALGDPHNPACMISFARTLEFDEHEHFPAEAAVALDAWGFHTHYVPEEYGGRGRSFETLLALLRVVARRDLTLAIAYSNTLLGAITVWAGGSPAQKEALAELIIAGGAVSLGLIEQARGSDPPGNGLAAVQEGADYTLWGQKRLINNATRGAAIMLFALTDPQGGPRGFSLFLVEREQLDPAGYTFVPKIPTHGIRGADISGMAFYGSRVPASAMVGASGSGQELVFKSFQVSRTMCAALSLGAGDTALRLTLDFALHRPIYRRNVFALAYPRRLLVDAFLDLLMCEALAIAAARAMHLGPAELSLWSATVKYFVPATIEMTLSNLTVVLGARSYLREGHWHGLFQKVVRDNALISLFDGSPVVNLEVVSQQLRLLSQQRGQPRDEEALALLMSQMFGLSQALPPFDADRLSLEACGGDLLAGVGLLLRKLALLKERDGAKPSAVVLDQLIGLIGRVVDMEGACEAERSRIQTQYGLEAERSAEMLKLAARTCTLRAVLACGYMWLYNHDELNASFAAGDWLVLCLARVVDPQGLDRDLVYQEQEARIADTLRLYHEEKRLFSLIPIQLA
ncbi:MAG: acyl-CoA dehydrogenase family protein [Ktedonobacterales bacterium]